MKIVHLNESKFNAILEEKKELPFQTFYEEVLKFIKGLLNDPIGTKPSEILRGYGLHNGMLRKRLLDYGVITKEEDIREPYDETDGKQKSRYYVSYKVPRENFKDKLRKLHSSLTSIAEAYHTSKGLMLHKNELGNDLTMRGQIDTMLNSPLTMGVVSSEDAPEYVKQATDIYNNKINRKNNTLNFVKQGDVLYPMGKAKDIIGKNKVTWNEFDFGLSQKLVKNGYKIAVKGDI